MCRLSLVVFLAILGVSGCALPHAHRRPASGLTEAERATHFTHRFDCMERLVRTRYYARDLHGVDWTELSARYRPVAAAALDDAAWYRTANTMLRELRDAHTRVQPRFQSRGGAALFRGGAALRENAETSVPGAAGFARVMQGGIVYLYLPRFDADSIRWLKGRLAAHGNAPGMILDLRDNRGGLVLCAQRAVGLFFAERVPMGMVVSRAGRRTIEHSIRSSQPAYSGALAILVGPGSHSSAEVLAHVMQHHQRAVLVGEPTAGQVLGARPYRLPDGGQLYVSVSDFQCLDGRRLEGAGVHPDVLVPPTRIGTEGPVDAPLTAAWEMLSDV